MLLGSYRPRRHVGYRHRRMVARKSFNSFCRSLLIPLPIAPRTHVSNSGTNGTQHPPIPASSVSSERLFSRAKQVSTDRRTQLGADVFEAIEALNFNWSRSLVDYVRVNSARSEEVELDEDIMPFLVLEEEEELFRGD